MSLKVENKTSGLRKLKKVIKRIVIKKKFLDPIQAQIWWVLSWPLSHPSSKFYVNLFNWKPNELTNGQGPKHQLLEYR